MILLYVISQLSDENYKISAVKNYMVDYLENVCAYRYRKERQTEKERIDVIHPDATAARANVREPDEEEYDELPINIEGEPRKAAKGEAARQSIRRTLKEKAEEEDQPTLKEETIRQILEEFLA